MTTVKTVPCVLFGLIVFVLCAQPCQSVGSTYLGGDEQISFICLLMEKKLVHGATGEQFVPDFHYISCSD